DALAILSFPLYYHKKLRTSNHIERLNREIRRREGVVTIFHGVDSVYRQLLAIKYPLIDFSLLSFQFIKSKETPISDYSAAWTQRVNSINTAYSYIFITILIALIGFVYYIVVIIKLYKRNHFEKKYGLSTQFSNDYPIYDTKMYLEFVINLAIVFSFFNFLTTIIVLIYGAVLVLTSYFFWYILKNKTEVLVMHKWWKSPNFVLFISVLLFQNGYTLLKAIFAQQFNVNLDLILSIILPIGTITIVITLLIKNMLATQVSAVKNAIKTISAKVSAFQIFYYTQKEKALEDYSFVNALPTFVKLPLQNNSINTKHALVLMQTIDETVLYFNSHFTKSKELNYMLYHLFNNITDVKEIEEIKSNIVKLPKKAN
uniref:transposase n=1 Tax=Spiroplasma sp. AdecLV25b TaxID=3027162 RepID=UPI0027E047D6